MATPITYDGALVLFDGICNICSWSVQFVIQRDPAGYFKFASLSSDIAKQLKQSHGIDPDRTDTVILITGQCCLTKSDAVLEVLRHLRGVWPLFSWLRLLPRTLRDACYDIVARNRYRWFGKRTACMVPSPIHLKRFL